MAVRVAEDRAALIDIGVVRAIWDGEFLTVHGDLQKIAIFESGLVKLGAGDRQLEVAILGDGLDIAVDAGLVRLQLVHKIVDGAVVDGGNGVFGRAVEAVGVAVCVGVQRGGAKRRCNGGGDGGRNCLVVRGPDDKGVAGVALGGLFDQTVGVLLEVGEPFLAQLLVLAILGGEFSVALFVGLGLHGVPVLGAAKQVLQVGEVLRRSDELDGGEAVLALGKQLERDAAAHGVAERTDAGLVDGSSCRHSR